MRTQTPDTLKSFFFFFFVFFFSFFFNGLSYGGLLPCRRYIARARSLFFSSSLSPLPHIPSDKSSYVALVLTRRRPLRAHIAARTPVPCAHSVNTASATFISHMTARYGYISPSAARLMIVAGMLKSQDLADLQTHSLVLVSVSRIRSKSRSRSRESGLGIGLDLEGLI